MSILKSNLPAVKALLLALRVCDERFATRAGSSFAKPFPLALLSDWQLSTSPPASEASRAYVAKPPGRFRVARCLVVDLEPTSMLFF